MPNEPLKPLLEDHQKATSAMNTMTHLHNIAAAEAARNSNIGGGSGGGGGGSDIDAGLILKGVFAAGVIGIMGCAYVFSDGIVGKIHNFFASPKERTVQFFTGDDGTSYFHRNASPVYNKPATLLIRIKTNVDGPGTCAFVDDDNKPIDSIPGGTVVEFETDSDGAGFYTINYLGQTSLSESKVASFPANRKLSNRIMNPDPFQLDDEEFSKLVPVAYKCFDSPTSLNSEVKPMSTSSTQLQPSEMFDVLPVVGANGKIPESVEMEAFQGTPYASHVKAANLQINR